jgi:hypothetical protein
LPILDRIFAQINRACGTTHSMQAESQRHRAMICSHLSRISSSGAEPRNPPLVCQI